MRVQAPLGPSEGHRPSRRPAAPIYAMIWSLLSVKIGPKCPKMAQNRSKSGQNAPKSAPIGLKWSKFDQNRSKMDQNDLYPVKIGPKMVQNGPKWILGEFRNCAKSFWGHFPFTACGTKKFFFSSKTEIGTENGVIWAQPRKKFRQKKNGYHRVYRGLLLTRVYRVAVNQGLHGG